MSILNALRAGVKAADTVLKSVQVLVQYERLIETDEFGAFQYASPYSLHAIVEERKRQVWTREGVLKDSNATLTLLSVLEIVMATGGEGVSENDRFTLPNGSMGLVLTVDGVLDAGTNDLIATTVYLK